MVTVTREEFLRGAADVLRRSETEGPIGVTGEDGRVRMIVHAPRDVRDTDEDVARIRDAARELLSVAYPAYCRARPIGAVSVTAWNELVDAMEKLRDALAGQS